MKKENSISQEVEKTLKSLDRIERVDVNPFLFGKIMHSLEEVNPVEKKFNFKYALGIVVICFLANLATIFYVSGNDYATTGTYSNNSADSVRTAQIESFASEYSSTNNFYFY